MTASTFVEPSSLEVFLTRTLGALAAPVYTRFIDWLPIRGNERLLDFGSGSGVCSKHLARKLLKGGGRLICVDISGVWMSVCRRTLRNYPNVEFRLGEISALDLPDASFDAVFIHFVIHDIDDASRAAILRRLAAKLVPGGKLYVREPIGADGIPVEDIRRLMLDSGLRESISRIVQVPTMGQTYEGVFVN